MAQKPACKDLGCNGQSPTITSKATYISVSKRASSRSFKRVHQPRNLRVRTLNAMTQTRSSRSDPLTLRFLTGLVHALIV
ncbi:hypothetical protein EFP22_11960 [Lacticaseibacillus paracasei]|nr:hypothetical protein [Lacticaseibacillus paracasei]